MDKVVDNHNDPEHRKRATDEVMLRKGWEAHGAWDPADRIEALDALGFQSQLVFTTAMLGPLIISDRGDDADLAYGVARGHNRAILDFCQADARLLPVCAVPLHDVERTAGFAGEAIEAGAAALMVASRCPKTHSPSHVGLDRTWAQAEEAGVPVVFHVGGGAPMDPTYELNGRPPVKDFIGGDTNFTSVSFLPIADAPMQTLGTMIIDGVLDRFPDLKFGVIEQGASWVPGWMRSMDAAADAFTKNEERPPQPVVEAERVRATPGAGHPLPPRARRVGHQERRAVGVPVQLRLPPHRGWPQPGQALRGVDGRRGLQRRRAQRVLRRQLRRPHGPHHGQGPRHRVSPFLAGSLSVRSRLAGPSRQRAWTGSAGG